SSGLHTNGYSLARKLFFEVGGYDVDGRIDELSASVGETLLAPHINYTQPILHLLAQKISIKGMAHITGGGLLENIPRVLPGHCAVEINKRFCPTLPVFKVLQDLGQLPDSESYRTFNMGIGLIMIVSPEVIPEMRAVLKSYVNYPLYEIGKVVAGKPEVRLLG
ncbi:MAG: phosphoribosylformylglycinamidine cyclo-ligase, partial [Legionella sp.]